MKQASENQFQQEQKHIQMNNYQSNPNISLTPSQYVDWYSTLTQQQIPYYYQPQQYQIWYNYYQNYQYQLQNPTNFNYNQYYQQDNNNRLHQNNSQPEKKEKLSKNQKRKLKKKLLQQQYDKQKNEIGKWVDLQRKDLVQGLKKIQQQQQKIKQKRKQKLSHLIQIHKQVYKHMMKKNKGKIASKEQAGNFRKKKKKPSHIKKMKQLYEKIRTGKLPDSKKRQNQIDKSLKQQKKQEKLEHEKIEQNDSDYVTQSQDQQLQTLMENKQNNEKQIKQIKKDKKSNGKKQVQKDQKKQQTQQQKPKQIKIIDYKKIGKLTGYIYNGISLRQWVDNIPSTKLQDIVLRFINRLAYKQAIKKVNQPQKARKLIIAGLHECKRTLWTKLDKKKSKLLILALNIQRNNLERGTDDQIQQVLSYAYDSKVPVVHISTRSKIGRAFTGKFGPRITMVSVINCEGYQDIMDAIIEQWTEMRRIYQETSQYCFKF